MLKTGRFTDKLLINSIQGNIIIFDITRCECESKIVVNSFLAGRFIVNIDNNEALITMLDEHDVDKLYKNEVGKKAKEVINNLKRQGIL